MFGLAAIGVLDALYALLNLGPAALRLTQYNQAANKLLFGVTLAERAPSTVLIGMGAASTLIAAALITALALKASDKRHSRYLSGFLAYSLVPTNLLLALGASVQMQLVLDGVLVGMMLGSFLRFSATFPKQLTVDDVRGQKSKGRFRRFLRVSFADRLLNGRVAWATTMFAGLITVVLGLLGHPALSGLGLILLLLLASQGIEYLRLGYKLADEGSRRTLIWIFGGFYVAAWVMVVGSIFEIARVMFKVDATARSVPTEEFGNSGPLLQQDGWSDVIAFLPYLIILLSLAVAIFYHGTVDPRTTLRRSTVFGALSVIMVAVFSLIESSISNIIGDMLGASRGTGGLVAGGIVALTSVPLHRVLERRVSRFIERMLPATTLANEGQRKNAIIVFSDIVGYTATSAEDPSTALTLAALFHKQARASAEQLGGRMVKRLGDAVLIEFRIVASACDWTIAMQTRFDEGCRLLELPATLLRTGIHGGEVVESSDGDLYGPTVNLASRLQSAAGPGEVWLTAATIDDAGMSDTAHRFESLGERHFKNVPGGIECCRLEGAASSPE